MYPLPIKEGGANWYMSGEVGGLKSNCHLHYKQVSGLTSRSFLDYFAISVP